MINMVIEKGYRVGKCTECPWFSRLYLVGEFRLLSQASIRHLKGHADRAEKELQASSTSVSGAPV